MKFSSTNIFGFGLTDNSCVDECLSAIEQDNEVFGYTVANINTFDNVFDSVSKQFDSNPAASSLAVFGLLDYAMRHQLEIANRHLLLLIQAKCNDPLGAYSERKVILKHFDKQLSSYISDQGLQANEYCN